MNLVELHKHVEIQIGDRVPYGEYFSLLLRIIKRLNITGEKPVVIEVITGTGDWEYTISDDPTIISDDTRIIGSGRWDGNKSWDSVNHALTLPREYSKVLDVFYNDERMECVPYDVLKASSSSDLMYANASNHIFFNKDVNSDTTKISIRARKDYPMPSRTDEEYEGLPEFTEGLLVTGILSLLYATPKYYNENLMYAFRKEFNSGLEDFNIQILSHDRQDHQTAQYTS